MTGERKKLTKRKIFKYKKFHYISSLRIVSMSPSDLKRLLDVYNVFSEDFGGLDGRHPNFC